ncbi:MAG: AzlC family ABC transporter permease [Anaerolineales bacterium]|nr:AzlC family ABC transporter permease [Anaerolineales bacterium]MCS7249171.1 AzlC family ABC transporter permease [Anaerolineales bacterium]MDW8162984.1 AzlC family ABC transporter permease [Anaerolineales bacterium]MDW8446767.1 AzlC family ABC transporter permease [Anaerolineales bacterium]
MAEPTAPPSLRAEFWRGVRAEFPLLIGVAPFGMIYGVLALAAGIPASAAQAMSAVVFAGSAQLITTQLYTATPLLLTVLTIFVVNLRHLLYSASLAPYLQKLRPGWKFLLAYLLTDEAYAVVIADYQRNEHPQAASPGFFLGAGLALWATWQASTAVGVFLGANLPQNWSLDFTLALTFIAIIVPTLKDRGLLAAAVVASLVAILSAGLPYKLGLLLAALLGILSGTWLGEEK